MPLPKLAVKAATRLYCPVMNDPKLGYLYFYSLVTMDVTRRQLTNVQRPEDIRTPANSFVSLREYPSADLRLVVSPVSVAGDATSKWSSRWTDLRDVRPVLGASLRIP
jgi:hypothetical protein